MIHVALIAFALAAPLPKNDAANSKATLAMLAELGLTDSYGKLSNVPDRYLLAEGDLKKVRDNPEEFPLRAVILKAGERIRSRNGDKFPTEFKATDLKSAKAAIEPHKKDLALRILDLEESLDEVSALQRLAEKESHPRWQAHNEFLLAYLSVELSKAHEYNTLLGNVATETIDEKAFDDGQNCLRLVAVDHLKCRKQYRDMAKAGKERFAAVAKAHRGTPWGDLAEKMGEQQLGLKWESVKLEK